MFRPTHITPDTASAINHVMGVARASRVGSARVTRSAAPRSRNPRTSASVTAPP